MMTSSANNSNRSERQMVKNKNKNNTTTTTTNNNNNNNGESSYNRKRQHMFRLITTEDDSYDEDYVDQTITHSSEDLTSEQQDEERYVLKHLAAFLQASFKCDNAGNIWEEMGIRFRLRVIDAVINLLVIAPITVLFYFGTWGLLDDLLLVALPSVGPWILLLVGTTVTTCAGYFQHYLAKFINVNNTEDNRSLVNYRAIFSRYIIACSNVCHMRAVELLLASYLNNDIYSLFRVVTTSYVILASIGCTKNIITSPLYVGLDIYNFNAVTSLYNEEAKFGLASLLDQAATYVIVHSTVYAHWHGVWAVFDYFIDPLQRFVDLAFTGTISTLLILFFIFNPVPGKSVSGRLGRQIISSLWHLAANGCTVLWWRALWMFFDGLAYYFPIWHHGYDLTFFYTNVISFALLTLLHSSETLVFLGCDTDVDSNTVNYETSFLLEFFNEDIDRLEEKEALNKTQTDEKPINAVNNTELLKGMRMRTKRKISHDKQLNKSPSKPSLLDVVKADHKKREEKAKAKKLK